MDTPIITHKTCTKCEENKELLQFHRDKKSRDGHAWVCKACAKEYDKNRPLLPKIHIASKGCSSCETFKPAAEFNVSRSAIHGLSHICKACSSAYYKSKPASAKEAMRVYSRKYGEVNKERIKVTRPKYIAERKSRDPAFVFATNMRSMVCKALKRRDTEKRTKTTEYLGATLAETRAHLESLFSPGMSWDNWKIDGWHIDHIRPLASFDKSDPDWGFKANHYTNLQPLWAADNLAKSDKWEPPPTAQ